jgi:hypothetical protein
MEKVFLYEILLLILIIIKQKKCEISRGFFALLRFAQNDRHLRFQGGGGWRRSRQPPPPSPELSKHLSLVAKRRILYF